MREGKFGVIYKPARPYTREELLVYGSFPFGKTGWYWNADPRYRALSLFAAKLSLDRCLALVHAGEWGGAQIVRVG